MSRHYLDDESYWHVPDIGAKLAEVTAARATNVRVRHTEVHGDG